MDLRTTLSALYRAKIFAIVITWFFTFMTVVLPIVVALCSPPGSKKTGVINPFLDLTTMLTTPPITLLAWFVGFFFGLPALITFLIHYLHAFIRALVIRSELSATGARMPSGPAGSPSDAPGSQKDDQSQWMPKAR